MLEDISYRKILRFYKTLSLWLEEPRLQEPGLYLPALPPQYMSQRLILLIQGDRVSQSCLGQSDFQNSHPTLCNSTINNNTTNNNTNC